MTRRRKIEELLKSTPDDVFLNYSHAMELSGEDEFQAARAAFARVRKLDPDYVPAYFQEGQMLARADEIEQARAVLEQGIAVALKVNDSHALGEMTEFLESL